MFRTFSFTFTYLFSSLAVLLSFLKSTKLYDYSGSRVLQSTASPAISSLLSISLVDSQSNHHCWIKKQLSLKSSWFFPIDSKNSFTVLSWRNDRKEFSCVYKQEASLYLIIFPIYQFLFSLPPFFFFLTPHIYCLSFFESKHMPKTCT